MANFAIIPIGGVGTRMNNSMPKQFLEIYNKSIYIYTLEKFQNHDMIDKIILAYPEGYKEKVEEECKKNNITKLYKYTVGGKTQLESIFNCINCIKQQLNDNDKIIIHVGNRPNLSSDLITKCITKYDELGALSTVVPGIEVLVNKETKEIIPRENIVRVQTPQVFSYEDIKDVINENYEANTMCDLFLKLNKDISFLDGELLNFKITYPEDLELFKKILK